MRKPRSLPVLFALALASGARASQPLETETARFLPRGTFEAEGTLEYQTSSQGQETALPAAFSYGVTNGLELLVEPVPYTAIRPDVGPTSSGVGDTEVTLSVSMRREGPVSPAFAAAAEVKVPTAGEAAIGTGKTDYTGYFIASKKLGRWDLHANLGYSVLGRPDGVEVRNIWDFGVAAEAHAGPKVDFLVEYLENTSALPASESAAGAQATRAESSGESAITPELTGGEKVGMLGMRYRVGSKTTFALGVTYDNNHAVLFRPGITFLF